MITRPFFGRPFLLFCCTILLVGLVGVPVQGAEYTVAPSGAGFTSIQDAVNWASPLDTVTVRSGTYPETVKISKKITLVGVDTGAGAPVIDPGSRGAAIEIAADGCTVRGFTVRNSEAAGIRIASNGNTVEDNTLVGNAVGIELAASGSNQVIGNSVSDSRQAGISLKNAQGNVIRENRVMKNSLGISVDERSGGNTIVLNTFSNTENVISKGSGAVWDTISGQSYVYLGKTSVSRMGNFWSDYHGTDQNSDGIGDTQYTVGQGMTHGMGGAKDEVDAFPLMDPAEYYTQVTPSSAALPVTTPVPARTGTIPSPHSTPPVTASPAQTAGPVPDVPERSDNRAVYAVAILAIIIAIGICVVLILRSSGKRRHRFSATLPLPEQTLARPPDLQKMEGMEEPVVPVRPAHPRENEAERTTPVAQETEVVPAEENSSPSAASKAYFPPELEGKYMDIRHIGRGGVANVFAAHRKSDNRLVAVKLPISFDEVTGKCFLNEIAAWQTLRHPNIVEVLEVNILPIPYVEMEYVPGSLEEVTKPLPVWKAVHIVHGIADGLTYAHAHGIIHRDIKPHNILMTGDFVPKITDWGMSKVIATTMAKSSVAGFSLSYAAPEQVSPAEFGRTDVRTDIYQLGALFYELVTGSIPFGGESIVEVGNAIVREDPIPPTEYNPEAEAVEKIILKCLAKNPADRYQTAEELLDALSRYLDEDD
jgi:parallel beta-helix repeat (two copies)